MIHNPSSNLARGLAVILLLLCPASATDLLWAPPEIGSGSVDSATILEAELIARGRSVVRVEQLSGVNLDGYESIWVCLGVYPNARALTLTEGQQLRDHVLAGRALFIEGGDIWGYDPFTPFHTVDGIAASADGTSDLYAIVGSDAPNGAHFAGLSADHIGENQFIDHLYADEPGAAPVLSHATGSYHVGVLHDGAQSNLGAFHLLGISFEFGGWGADRGQLLERILIGLGLEVVCSLAGPTNLGCDPIGLGAELTWQNLAPYSSIEIMRDGAVVAILPGTVTSWVDPAPPEGMREYRLRGIDGSCVDLGPPCTITVGAGGMFRRGDLDDSGTVDVSDAIQLVQALFLPGTVIDCPDAGDVNDSGVLDIADPIVLLRAIFESGPPPAAPGPIDCGTDPTPDPWTCSGPCSP